MSLIKLKKKYKSIIIKEDNLNVSLVNTLVETKVVNVKVSTIRPKYKDLKEWMNDPENIYIGRAGIVFIDGERFPKTASPFCNPFKLNKEGTREDVIQKFKTYIVEKINQDPNFKQQLYSLRGKTLGCWCKPEQCHGDVLVECIEQYTS